MASYTLLDLSAQLRAIGRASVFYKAGAYTYVASPTGADLTLTHLGDTEGEIGIELNEEYSAMTLPELTGSAMHNRYIAGESPVVTIPLYVADPALRAIVSPTGSASGGYMRRRAVTEYTLVLIPEEVFIEGNAQVALAGTNTAGTMAWTVGGDAATAAQLSLLGNSIWFWRGHFTKAAPIYKHEDGGKVVQSISFQSLYNTSMPDGHKLYTIGKPESASTPILVDAG
jgi:hypothetical protein